MSRGTTRGIIIKDIAGSPKVWLLFLITTITFLCNACGGLLQPLIGAKLGGVRGYTWLSVSNDIGCLLGSLVLLRLKKHTIQEQIALAAASSAFIVGVGLVGVVLPPNLLLAAVMLGAGCVTIQIQNTGTEILVQRYVPLHKLGRVGGHLEFIRTTGTAISIVCAGYMLIPTIGASVTNATLSGAALASFGGVEVLFIYLFYSGKLAKSSFNK